MHIKVSVILHALVLLVYGDFELTLLHTNDCHARIEEFSKHISACPINGSLNCYGGVARRYTAIQDIRRREKNVLLVDAGDQYTGTLWFDYYKGASAAKFMNILKYDAMTLGNHEFDNGPVGLHPFLKKVKFPVVTSNLDFSKQSTWPKDEKFNQKSVIIDVGGKKIGIVGYVTPETKWLSPSGNVTFKDILPAVRKEIKKLKRKGVNIFVILGHANLADDKQVAREIEDVDIVVGGHTNTFLYTGTPPSSEKPLDTYPIVIQQKTKRSLLVHDYAYGKYLGYLKVIFDDDGNVKKWKGNPILLNSSFQKDEMVMKELNMMIGPVLEKRGNGIGYVSCNGLSQHLDGARDNCRVRECNMGNLCAESIAVMNNIALGIWNSGSIRASISKKPEEPILESDLFDVMPFSNTADRIIVSGKVLKEVFEHSVAGLPEKKLGQFLQVSGFRMKYDISKKIGERLVELKALCIACPESTYEYVEDNKLYKVVTSSYILDGGDGFDMFKVKERQSGEDSLTLLENYVKQNSPICPDIDGRIQFIDSNRPLTDSGTSPRLVSVGVCGYMCFIFIIITFMFNL